MIELERHRQDWVATPGWEAQLRIGPLHFGVYTADGWGLAFAVRLGRFEIGWIVDRDR